MRDQIASLHDRMMQGGDWKEWRDEIAALHGQAKTQEEFVVLLGSFINLIAVGPAAYDQSTWERVLPVAMSKYKAFLNAEACEGGSQMNPLLLKQIVEREIAAGRLHSDDDYAQFAIAGGNVLGDASDLIHPPPRPGDWLAGGLAIGGILLWIAGVASPYHLFGSSRVGSSLAGFPIIWRERRSSIMLGKGDLTTATPPNLSNSPRITRCGVQHQEHNTNQS